MHPGFGRCLCCRQLREVLSARPGAVVRRAACRAGSRRTCRIRTVGPKAGPEAARSPHCRLSRSSWRRPWPPGCQRPVAGKACRAARIQPDQRPAHGGSLFTQCGFGAVGVLAMYCVAARDQEADGRALPAVVPVPRAASTACTCALSSNRKAKSARRAQRVILTCVGCHLRKRHAG